MDRSCCAHLLRAIGSDLVEPINHFSFATAQSNAVPVATGTAAFGAVNIQHISPKIIAPSRGVNSKPALKVEAHQPNTGAPVTNRTAKGNKNKNAPKSSTSIAAIRRPLNQRCIPIKQQRNQCQTYKRQIGESWHCLSWAPKPNVTTANQTAIAAVPSGRYGR